MKALILAAGRSKRMKPIKDKNFLSFLGKPLLKWQIEMLQKSGFEDITVVAGAHNMVQIEELTSRIKSVDGGNFQVVEQKDLGFLV